MMTMWRFVHTGNRTPAENMAIDEAMLTAHERGLVPPTVRFYGWNPATLSIGCFQHAAKEVDFTALREYGLGFVRRSTGGRAVLHDQELTYSIIVSENYPGIPASVVEAYRVLSMGLLLGFRKLGLDAHMTGLESSETQTLAEWQVDDSRRGNKPMSAACFDAPSKYELVVEGRKIAGSAQMRSKGVILQHGSILLELDSDLLFNVLNFTDPEDKQRMKKIFERKAVDINSCLRRKGDPSVTIRDLEETFHQGFAENLGTELIPGTLTDFEIELANRLAEEKYGADSWNLKK
ncbi:lipoate-protein ligase A [Paenibacillus sp. PastF-1]|nr:lipoate-protein ligase A [Paenibacillus sp. PastF-2]MDF9849716.1 lipoate-protein ligase A [Paenibacillus sp. PastM-2]MDF9856367.1 lipoate-protein ligase A [Paenibacillus sp. PastF-1]MDH6481638.1 lipoate-protein ligase A [Paenibacillus sp. PastH-2]MDH6508920.1 lipoate-protein ligase A [Paenibacillus sp. PastM-3]